MARKNKSNKKNVEIRRFVTVETKKQNGITVKEVGLRGDFDQEAFQAFIDEKCGKKRPSQKIVQPGVYNTIMAAPTRSGKGVSSVMPFILSCPESQSVLDFMGESFTTRRRRSDG